MAFEKAYGTQFQIGTTDLSGTPTYTTIAQVAEIGDWGLNAVMAETTAHDATGGYREKIPSGIHEVDDIELTLVYDPATATHDNAAGGVMHAHLNETKLAYKLILPDTSTTTWTFEAYVSSVVTMTGNGEEALRQTATFTITGQPTLS